MTNIKRVDLATKTLSIAKDHTVSVQAQFEGPPATTAGINIGMATLEQSPPHNGEQHNDGDEIIIVISGKVTVTSDSNPELELVAGEACVIKKGEWHKVHVVEKAKVIYVTPGENNQYRF